MPLINCPECGKENVSNTAASCPNCGYNIRAHFEKIKLEEEQIKQQEKNDAIKAKVIEKIKKTNPLIKALCIILFLIVISFGACTLLFYNNPFKRIGPKTKWFELVLSYGLPDEELFLVEATWNNVKFCGLNGSLKVKFKEDGNEIWWKYNGRMDMVAYYNDIVNIEHKLISLSKDGTSTSYGDLARDYGVIVYSDREYHIYYYNGLHLDVCNK